MNILFSLPLLAWGAICLVIAFVWTVWWPRDRVGAAQGVRFVILRWFHALTWLLLAIAAFLAGLNPVASGAARLIAFCGLIVYLVFMATLVTSRR